MRSSPMLAAVLLLFAVSSPLPATAAEYLIVTTDELAGAFQELANYKVYLGYTTEILTVEDLQGSPGRDVPEQIRGAVQARYALGDLRFVLLGGDTDQIPARYARSEFYPAGDPDGTDVPTDLYFATLDGDWDADADNVFGEVVDVVDLDPEVAVGRVPVSTVAEVEHYVAKAIVYEGPFATSHLGTAVLLEEVLFPSNWIMGQPIQLDGATYGEELRGIFEAAPLYLGTGRAYENHVPFAGSVQLTKAQALAEMGSGTHGLVVHGGWGNATNMSMGDDAIEPADVEPLANGPHYFAMMTLQGSATAFDEATVLEALLRDPDGGAVLALGPSVASFPLETHGFLVDVSNELFQASSPSLGEVINLVRAQRAAAAVDENVTRWTLFAMNLLGDPELEIGSPVTNVGTPAAASASVVLHEPVPNPFNPSVTIRLEVRGGAGEQVPVTVTIHDAAGRRIRTLWTGPVVTGPAEFVWDGRDAEGRSLGSGVYFAAAEALGQRHATKLTLIK